MKEKISEKQLKFFQYNFPKSKDLINNDKYCTDKDRIICLPDLNRKIEEEILDAINFFDKKCPYCDENLYKGNIRSRIAKDHYIPIDKGGQHVPWNILPVCKKCNNKKSNKLPEVFLGEDKKYLCDEYLKDVRDKYIGQIQKHLEKFIKIEKYISDILKNTDPNKQANLPSHILDLAKILEFNEIQEKIVAGEKDEIQCLNHILQSVVDVKIEGKRYECSVIDLILSVTGDNDGDMRIGESLAKNVLALNGLKVNPECKYLYISNSHSGIKRILRGTAWEVKWNLILKRIEGSKIASSYRFEYRVTRAVGVPMEVILIRNLNVKNIKLK